MADPNMTDFYRRVSRIEKMRAKGYGFEAAGALGRSYYTRQTAPRRSLMGPIIFVLACVFLLKGTMYHEVGAESYNTRIASLMAGDGVENVGGWILQAEPVTVYVAGKMDDLLKNLK
jgi:hypothetical protein